MQAKNNAFCMKLVHNTNDLNDLFANQLLISRQATALLHKSLFKHSLEN